MALSFYRGGKQSAERRFNHQLQAPQTRQQGRILFPREGLARNQQEQPGQALPTYRALGLEQMLSGHFKKSPLHWNQPQSL